MHLPCIDVPAKFVNNVFQNKEPWQIVTMTTTATIATIWLWNFIFQDESKYNISIYKIIRQIIVNIVRKACTIK